MCAVPQQMFVLPCCEWLSSLDLRWGVLIFPPLEQGAVHNERCAFVLSLFSCLSYFFCLFLKKELLYLRRTLAHEACQPLENKALCSEST